VKVVSTFEENLLRILRTIVTGQSVDAVLTILLREMKRPDCFGQDAVDLVQEALSIGIVQRLAKLGWHPERYLSRTTNPETGSLQTGRFWDRTPLPARQLTFSHHTMDWLIWLTSVNFAKPVYMPPRPKSGDAFTTGDRVFAFLLFQALEPTQGGPVLLKHAIFREDGLAKLMFPESWSTLKSQYPESFDHWLTDDAVWFLKLMQKPLAERWIATELSKKAIVQPSLLRSLSDVQRQTLSTFFLAIDQIGRRDLSRFLLTAAATIFADVPHNEPWFDNLDLQGIRVADRVQIETTGHVFPKAIQQLERWQAEAIAVSFYDEEYTASQLWKSDWELYRGHEISTHANRILRQTSPLSSTGHP